jgi:hypothetical protein
MVSGLLPVVLSSTMLSMCARFTTCSAMRIVAEGKCRVCSLGWLRVLRGVYGTNHVVGPDLLL